MSGSPGRASRAVLDAFNTRWYSRFPEPIDHGIHGLGTSGALAPFRDYGISMRFGAGVSLPGLTVAVKAMRFSPPEPKL